MPGSGSTPKMRLCEGVERKPAIKQRKLSQRAVGVKIAQNLPGGGPNVFPKDEGGPPKIAAGPAARRSGDRARTGRGERTDMPITELQMASAEMDCAFRRKALLRPWLFINSHNNKYIIARSI